MKKIIFYGNRLSATKLTQANYGNRNGDILTYSYTGFIYRRVFVTILTQANATKLTQANYGNRHGDILTLLLPNLI